LNDELLKDWSKIAKLDNLSELLMSLQEMGHQNERFAEQRGLRDGSKGNKTKGKKRKGGKKGKMFKKVAGGSPK